jgi:hypothetical protein
MTKTRDLSDLLDANGDVKSTALDNVPASNDASALTTGTLPNDRLSAVPNSALANSSITINGSATALGGSATINTDLVNDTSPELGANLSTNGNDINFGDNDKAVFGTGNDLEIYHDGSDSYIEDNGIGNLRLNGNEVHILSNDNSEYSGRFITNGAVELYYDNSKKFETTSTGVTVTGTLTATAGVANTASVWVNFNGTGTVAIRDDYNVSTITDHDTGLYTINFSSALVDNDYACGGMACDAVGSGGAAYVAFRSPYYQGIDTILTTTSCKVNIINSGNSGVDPQACSFIAFR